MKNYRLCAFADEADVSLDGQIKALKENGISLLEIRGIDGENISKITKEKAKQIRASLNDQGISVWSIGSPYGKIKIADDFSRHLDSFKYGLELAHILGAENMRIFSFYVPSGESDRYRDEVLSRIDAFLDAAKDSNVTLCHENEKGIYGDTADRCADIHNTFPGIRAVFDPANFVQCKEDTKRAWGILCDYVKYLHIKDSMSDGTVVAAGMGAGNLPFIISQYKGDVLTLEPHLSDFVGLQELEAGSESRSRILQFGSKRDAFDAAVRALKDIIGEVK